MPLHPVFRPYFQFLRLAIIALLATAPDPAQATPGDIYISQGTGPCCDTNEIDRVSPAGSVSVFAASGLSQPWGLAFDAAGNLFVANTGDNTIERFTPSGLGTVFASTGLDNPSGLAFDAAGNLFVTSTGNNTIEKFTPNGVGTVFASTGLAGPRGLAFNASGNLFVANAADDTIEKFTPSAAASMFANTALFDPVFETPVALAFDASGNLFVGSGLDTIDRYTPSGTESPFSGVGPQGPFGLAFDNAGNLLVADGFGGSVVSIAPNGDQQTIATGFGYASGVAVEPAPAVSSVPEPAAALILATAVAGLRLTRHRQWVLSALVPGPQTETEAVSTMLKISSICGALFTTAALRRRVRTMAFATGSSRWRERPSQCDRQHSGQPVQVRPQVLLDKDASKAGIIRALKVARGDAGRRRKRSCSGGFSRHGAMVDYSCIYHPPRLIRATPASRQTDCRQTISTVNCCNLPNIC
jgi:sugar lactone lactonase YvrE